MKISQFAQWIETGLKLPLGFSLMAGFSSPGGKVTATVSIRDHHVIAHLDDVFLMDANNKEHKVGAVRLNGKGTADVEFKGSWYAVETTPQIDAFVYQLQDMSRGKSSWLNTSTTILLPRTLKVEASAGNGMLVLDFSNQKPEVDLPGPLKNKLVARVELTDRKYRARFTDGSEHGGDL